jgi:spore cortex biosynthesis protein YabQ
MVQVNLQTQFWMLICMFMCGMCMGIVFDFLKIILRTISASSWTKAIIDMLYWGLVTVFVMGLLYYMNEGSLRGYIYLCIAIGACFYFALCSQGFSKVLAHVIRIFIQVMSVMLRVGKSLINLFVFMPFKIVYRGCVIFIAFMMTVAIFMFKIMIQSFYPMRKLIQWLFSLFLYPAILNSRWFLILKKRLKRIRKRF